MILDSNVKTGIRYAAEVAAEYIWSYLLEMDSSDEDAENAAITIYKKITGEDINIREFLGLD